MLVAVGIAQHFENFQNMRLAQAFVGAPAHCGELAVQGGVSAEFGAEGVVGHVHHGGEFFGRIEHAEGFRGDIWDGWDFHGTFRNLRNLRKVRDLMRNNRGFGTFLNWFGTFGNDFESGANVGGIFSYCKDIFLNCDGKIFEKREKKPQVSKKKFKMFKQGVYSVIIR